jgi:hypothetical protein
MPKKNITENVIAAFGKTVSKEILEKLVDGRTAGYASVTKQDRILAAFTETGQDIQSEYLYDCVSQKSILDTWVVECLLPVPLLSRPCDTLGPSAIQALRDLSMNQEKECRVIFAKDVVAFGQHGSGIMAYGSAGSVILDLICACGLLPPKGCWVDENTARLLGNYAISEGRLIRNRRFGRLE